MSWIGYVQLPPVSQKALDALSRELKMADEELKSSTPHAQDAEQEAQPPESVSDKTDSAS